ncbi:hypothetical protein N7492_005037 [Penicillium capsulatum]|uniref:SAP domain-containing protein n=1 Tax=Penicillium capsulatum TaxID=69766 RepID=A0A9W9IAX8_9EURO|nr:hypothetical protein N7492_005037 [Penicillium capsulatum]KAJ6135854.1 hypothetical protein N7512_001014 [Penicillium capsulatum]
MPAPSLALRTHPWLTSLKAAQLQRLARATGVQSSGTRAALIERVGDVLRGHERESATGLENSAQDELGSGRGETGARCATQKTRRVLSIDMGVRNFAFAHFRVQAGGTGTCAPELMAWRRLAVSDIGELETGVEPESESEADVNQDRDLGLDKEVATSDNKYQPHIYAATAYTLISTLLATYRPTHILIERQRFRSGGSKAVLEWSLRVGVLEGMLHAVLHALRAERAEMARVCVHGVEPNRVVRYWADNVHTSGSGLEIASGKISPRQLKKAKIDLVGRWLDGSTGAGAEPGKVVVGSDPAVRDLVDGYVRKWKSPRSRSPGVLSAGKVDDLADCLLQGMTWLEWQATRDKLAREGEKALTSIL